jgi:hypothetical protein
MASGKASVASEYLFTYYLIYYSAAASPSALIAGDWGACIQNLGGVVRHHPLTTHPQEEAREWTR